jgi:hypothetical protein
MVSAGREEKASETQKGQSSMMGLARSETNDTTKKNLEAIDRGKQVSISRVIIMYC